jgi:DNA transformation protein and related proteins
VTRPVAQLKGLGPKSSQWLAEIDIRSDADLRAVGSIEAWHRLRLVRGPQVTLNALYAMEAAIRDCHWRALPDDVKAKLMAEATKTASPITSRLQKPGKSR